MHMPLEEHWTCVKRILQYLNSTATYGLILHAAPMTTMTITAYYDADWGADLEDRRSISGHCVFLGPNLVTWGSKKQHTVSRSTTEAEYRSLANLVAEIMWIQSLLQEINMFRPPPPLIHRDNLSTVLLAANHVLHSRTKHLELDLFFVCEKVRRKKIIVRHIPLHLQLADGLTKPLSDPEFQNFRSNLKVACYEDLRLREDIK